MRGYSPTKLYRLGQLKVMLAKHKSDKCLLWPFGKDDHGYGFVAINGQSRLAHRVAFWLTYGRWPTPMGLHSCNVPSCINPRHIREGDQFDNMKDAAIAGTKPVGERNGSAKLTNELVLQIRSEHIPGKYGKRRLARKYGVGTATVQHILWRKTWKHL